MNYPDSGTVTATGKSTRFSSAARALVVGLALVLPGAAALAINDPIPGVDIIVKKNPGPSGPISAPTGADGAYQFKGLAPGKYDLFVGGQRVQTINVGANRSISGVLSSDGGKASITFNGQVGVVPDLPSAIVTTRSNIKRPGKAVVDDAAPDGPQGVAAEGSNIKATGNVSTTRRRIGRPGALVEDETAPGIVGDPIPGVDYPVNPRPSRKITDNESPKPTDRGIRVEVGDVDGDGRDELSTGHAPKKVSHGTGPHRSLKTGESAPDDVLPSAPVNATRSNKKAGIAKGDGGARPVSTTRGTAPHPESGDTAPGIFDRWGNRAPPPPADINGDVKPATIVSSGATLQLMPSITVNPVNDAPSKAADPIPTAFGQPVTFTATVAPVNPANNPPGIAGPGDPIPGVGVGLEGDPEGVKITTKTDKTGAYQFTGLPAGKYKLIFPGLPAKSITIGTDGKTGGKVLRDGNNVIVTGDFEGSPARSQATANPVPDFLGGGFPGIGNVMGGILPGMSPGAGGPGAGPMSPAAGPMGPGGPAGPMGPGAGAIRR